VWDTPAASAASAINPPERIPAQNTNRIDLGSRGRIGHLQLEVFPQPLESAAAVTTSVTKR
jgi:hypothetical protein